MFANMRGAGGEPTCIFEHDFPPGTDMMTEIREGRKVGDRVWVEIATGCLRSYLI